MSWAVQKTRPDLLFDARDLATRNKDTTLGDIKIANKVLKKVQSKGIKIKYNKLGKWDKLKITGFTDSSFRNDENFTKSVGGRILFLANKEGKYSPLSWKCKTIQQVSL